MALNNNSELHVALQNISILYNMILQNVFQFYMKLRKFSNIT